MIIVTVNGVRGYYIFRASRTLEDGTKIYARDYGKRAFRIFIKL